MLTVDFDPDRPRGEGQYHVRLIDAASGDYGNDARRQSQLGYWCDIGHLVSGILAPLLCHIEDNELERVREYARPKKKRWCVKHGWTDNETVEVRSGRYPTAGVTSVCFDCLRGSVIYGDVETAAASGRQ